MPFQLQPSVGVGVGRSTPETVRVGSRVHASFCRNTLGSGRRPARHPRLDVARYGTRRARLTRLRVLAWLRSRRSRPRRLRWTFLTPPASQLARCSIGWPAPRRDSTDRRPRRDWRPSARTCCRQTELMPASKQLATAERALGDPAGANQRLQRGPTRAGFTTSEGGCGECGWVGSPQLRATRHRAGRTVGDDRALSRSAGSSLTTRRALGTAASRAGPPGPLFGLDLTRLRP